jgi:hypothetical protein
MNYNLILKRLDNDLPKFLTLDEIKLYLRVDFQEDDQLLINLAVAACEKAENFTALNLLERFVKQVAFDVCGSEIQLHHAPIMKIESVLDENNLPISSEIWVFNEHDNKIEFLSEQRSSKISIHYISGFTRSNIAQSIKIGLLEYISSLYDGNSVDLDIPFNSIDLYSAYRNKKIWR